jgi:hypothetical protein
MTKDTPRLYGHAAPWNRPAPAAPTPVAVPASSGRWPWVVLAAVVVAAVSWLVLDAAVGL